MTVQAEVKNFIAFKKCVLTCFLDNTTNKNMKYYVLRANVSGLKLVVAEDSMIYKIAKSLVQSLSSYISFFHFEIES